MTLTKHLYVVDDDETVRSSMGFFLESTGYVTHLFDCGRAFLGALPAADPGCVLLDIRLPDIDGLDIIELLGERVAQFPVIIMTGHGDVATAVRAMKLGASDFLEKPFQEQALLDMIESAFATMSRDVIVADQHADACRRLEALSNRESDILSGLVSGLQNKMLAYKLGISVRTVEMHRSSMMTRLAVKSLPEALRLAYLAGATPGNGTIGLADH